MGQSSRSETERGEAEEPIEVPIVGEQDAHPGLKLAVQASLTGYRRRRGGGGNDPGSAVIPGPRSAGDA
jgi:hypothetical protein